MYSERAQARKEAFAVKDAVLEARARARMTDGYDGAQQFAMNNRPVRDFLLSPEVGPSMKTRQWERTKRRR